MKKSFYMFQVNISYDSPWFLPYGMGCIAAYLMNDETITGHYEFPDIIVAREKPEDVIERVINPDIVSFSCFAWNYEYNKSVAKLLKEKYPGVIILFGGHSISPDGKTLDELPFVDYLMHKEGEETTALFLKALINGTSMHDVPNLSFRENGKIINTPFYVPSDIYSYPSPYLNGVFDGIMKEFPQIEFHATLETNRGCPYQCAYCEWSFSKNLRLFSMEKVRAEIEWIAQHKIKYVYCADANFGILDRDVEIAEYVVRMKEKYGYPDIFKPAYAKESNDNVFKAGYILNKNNADKGVTLSYQSLNSDALENIGRKNIMLDKFKDLDCRYKDAGIPTFTDLILGLPGETFDSFCRGLCSLIESGQDNAMTVYECQVYPNSLMADPEYQKKHGIKTVRIPSYGIHYNPNFNGVSEYLDIIVETNTMPHSDWVKANMFSVVLLAFHHMALLRFFAVYVHREKQVSYFDFYNSLFNFIFDGCEGFLHNLFEELKARKEDTENADWTYRKEELSSTGWYFEEGVFLEVMKNSEAFWSEIRPFLEKFGIEEELLEDLIAYQKGTLRGLNEKTVDIFSGRNFYPYFNDSSNSVKLRKCRSHLRAEARAAFDNWQDYAREVVWFGKRYSAMLMINPREKVEYTEEGEE